MFLPNPFPDYTSENSLDTVLCHIRRNLRGAWTEDPEFYAKFFPVDTYTRDTFIKSKKGLYSRKRWTGLPSNPVAVSKVYTPLNNLINNLLDEFNLLDDHQVNRRLSLKTSKGVEPRLEYRIRSPLLIASSGTHFLASRESCRIVSRNALRIRYSTYRDQAQIRGRNNHSRLLMC
jgi:hypothetical protein